MDTIALSALFLAALVKAAIPGPVLLLVLARAAQGGLSVGAAAALGAILAVALLFALGAGTLVGVLSIGETAFAAMKLAGIATITIFGLRMLATTSSTLVGEAALGGNNGRVAGFAAGLALGLTSPFNLIFFLALLPQFVDPTSLTMNCLVLACGLALLASAVPLAVVSCLGAAHSRLAPQAAPWVVRGGGVAMIGFAGLVTVSAF